MKTITITTPDNVDIEYRLAGAGARLAAAAIDLLIQLTFIFIIIAAMLYAPIYRALSADTNGPLYDMQSISGDIDGYVMAIGVVGCFIIYFGYFLICDLLMNGRSFGKKALSLRVLRGNGQPVGLAQSIIRNVIRYFIDFFGIGIIMILFTQKCRRLGDIAASTIVVAENPHESGFYTMLDSNQLAEVKEISGKPASALSADEYYILKEYLMRRDSFIDNGENIRRSLTKYFLNGDQ